MSHRLARTVVLLTLGCLFMGSCMADTQSVGKIDTRVVTIGVDDIAADPGAYDGVIGIRGIVSFVYPSDSTFVIIDVKEYELCGVVTCAINEIAVTIPSEQYSGELPNVEDEVVVYGEITTQGAIYSLEVLEVKRGEETILKRVTG